MVPVREATAAVRRARRVVPLASSLLLSVADSAVAVPLLLRKRFLFDRLAMALNDVGTCVGTFRM